jgi:nucleotide-binding universal stress UspA family protein
MLNDVRPQHASQGQDRQPLKLILVPTDFSVGAEPALRWASTLAEAAGAEIVLLHVLDLVAPALVFTAPEMGVWIDEPMIQEIRNQANASIAALAARLPRARTLIREGNPRSVILEVAKELGADLIVMGTHGRTGLAHVLLGSVAEHVVRYGQRPVLTVRQEGTR